jgi:hypothetical protein
VAVGSRLFAIGGGDAFSPTPTTAVEYTTVNPDGTLGVWQLTSSLVAPRFYMAVASWGSYVCALGGISNGVYLDSVERAVVQLRPSCFPPAP